MKRTTIASTCAGLVLVGGLALTEPQGAMQAPGSTVMVATKQAGLKSTPKNLSPSIATLNEGEACRVLAVEGSWYRVEAGGRQGYLHYSSVRDSERFQLVAYKSTAEMSEAERTAAARGFNPQVEKERRAQHPDLEPGYRKMDQIEADTRYSDSAIEAFLRAGGLLP